MNEQHAEFYKRRSHIWLGLLAVFAIAVAAIWEARALLVDPQIVLLIPKDGSQWIQLDRPLENYARGGTLDPTTFQTHLEIPPSFAGADLQVRALRQVQVLLDGNPIFDTGLHVTNWKLTYHIPLPPALSPGPHNLELKATNPHGPALVWAYAPQLQLHTDQNWQASADGTSWLSVVSADAPRHAQVEYSFGPCASDVLAMSPLLLFFFAIGFVAAMFMQRNHIKRDWIRMLRWAMLLGWILFALNNLFKFPFFMGYDALHHLDYIRFILQNHRIPLPDEGWEFFQAPLYYLISAALYHLMQLAGVATDTADRWLRIVPLLCSIGIFEVCYRTAKIIFPHRRDLQAVAMILGGLLPMNLYMATPVSNEPMAGFLGSLIALISIGILAHPAKPLSLRTILLAGTLLGLALLTKITAILWIPPLLFAIGVAVNRQGASLVQWAKYAAIILLLSILICSGYYLHNWIQTGRPFIIGSQIGDKIPWQDPGFRTPRQFLEFGRVFARPIYSGINSIWDSLYSTFWADGLLSGSLGYQTRPPWNYRLMSCGIWLGVLPTIAILAAIVAHIIRTLRQLITKDRGATSADPPSLAPYGFAILTIACFVGAIMHEYLKNPMFSYGKASYMLGLTPCFAILAASGFNMLPNHRMIRSVAVGFLFCWAGSALLTYWIF